MPRPRYPELDAIVLEDDPAAALASEDLATPPTATHGSQVRHGRPVRFFGRVSLPPPTAWRHPRHSGHVFWSHSRHTPVEFCRERHHALHARRCRLSIINRLCVSLMNSRDVVLIEMFSDTWLSLSPAGRHSSRTSVRQPSCLRLHNSVAVLGDAPCQPRTSKRCTSGWNH